MFHILESVAVMEMQKDPKKFLQKREDAEKRSRNNFLSEEEEEKIERDSLSSDFEFDKDQEEEMFEDAS